MKIVEILSVFLALPFIISCGGAIQEDENKEYKEPLTKVNFNDYKNKVTYEELMTEYNAAKKVLSDKVEGDNYPSLSSTERSYYFETTNIPKNEYKSTLLSVDNKFYRYDSTSRVTNVIYCQRQEFGINKPTNNHDSNFDSLNETQYEDLDENHLEVFLPQGYYKYVDDNKFALSMAKTLYLDDTTLYFKTALTTSKPLSDYESEKQNLRDHYFFYIDKTEGETTLTMRYQFYGARSEVVTEQFVFTENGLTLNYQAGLIQVSESGVEGVADSKQEITYHAQRVIKHNDDIHLSAHSESDLEGLIEVK